MTRPQLGKGAGKGNIDAGSALSVRAEVLLDGRFVGMEARHPTGGVAVLRTRALGAAGPGQFTSLRPQRRRC
ncbi:hypothetical protein HRbin33_01716 [bacterium HR33]|nr:hypothetical protein HRbin33_01716 [bacterium HR33]